MVNYCFPASTDALPDSFKEGWRVALKTFLQNPVGKYFNDMYLSSRAIYWSFGMGLVYSFFYIYLMSAFAETIAWVCVVLIQVGLIGGSIMCWMMRSRSIEQNAGIQLSPEVLKNAQKTQNMLMAGCIIIGILALSFFCCVFCGYHSLKLAIDVIDAAADFMAKTKRIILVPILYFMLTMVALLIWSGSFASIVSMNEIHPDPDIPQAKSIIWKDDPFRMAIYMLFGILWVCAWLEYSSTFVVMVSASTYYFNSNS